MSEEEYKGYVWRLDDMLEHLYDLDRTELRRLALEALLISDGPDRVKQKDGSEAPVNNSTVRVTMKELGPDPSRPTLPDNAVMFVIDGI